MKAHGLIVVLALASVALAGCVTWRPAAGPPGPADVQALELEPYVSVSKAGQRYIEATAPQIEARNVSCAPAERCGVFSCRL